MSIMQPETHREAWERGREDGQHFTSHGNPATWEALTGSDPREPGYEEIFKEFARDWRAGFTYGMAESVQPDASRARIADWLHSEPGLLRRARQLIDADERDSTGLFPWWVEGLLFGSTTGPFDFTREPEHDARKALNVSSRTDREHLWRFEYWPPLVRLVHEKRDGKE